MAVTSYQDTEVWFSVIIFSQKKDRKTGHESIFDSSDGFYFEKTLES